jgi:hypothetical protein
MFYPGQKRFSIFGPQQNFWPTPIITAGQRVFFKSLFFDRFWPTTKIFGPQLRNLEKNEAL